MAYKGVVKIGKKYGQKLGFPTVNIEIPDREVSGIFAATVVFEGKEYPAAAYADPLRGTLEAHILDFSGDIYGKEIEIELQKKIRESERFADEAALKAAIAEDVKAVRQYFGL